MTTIDHAYHSPVLTFRKWRMAVQLGMAFKTTFKMARTSATSRGEPTILVLIMRTEQNAETPIGSPVLQFSDFQNGENQRDQSRRTYHSRSHHENRRERGDTRRFSSSPVLRLSKWPPPARPVAENLPFSFSP